VSLKPLNILTATTSLLFSWLLIWPILHFHQVHVLNSGDTGPISVFVKPKADDQGSRQYFRLLDKLNDQTAEPFFQEQDSKQLVFLSCLVIYEDIKTDVIKGQDLVMSNRPPPACIS
jgi:hypothetical protein